MSEESLAALLVSLGVFIIFIGIIALAVTVVLLIGKWKFFKKAGKNGWEAIIPFYSDWVLVEIAGLDWYWFLALIAGAIFTVLGSIIPAFSYLGGLANIAVILGRICVFYNLSKKLHKDTSWIVLGTLFEPVMCAVAGFSKTITYDAEVSVPKNGFFDKNK